MAVGLLAAGGGGGVAVEARRQGGALLVGHVGEVETDVADPVEGDDGLGDAALDLVAQRAAGDGEGDEHLYVGVFDGHLADHVEVDDAAVQLGILDRAEGFDDSGLGEGHQGLHFSYGDR